MEVIGRGFLAGNFQGISDRHPDVTLIAAGVSATGVENPAEFARESELVRSVTDRCRLRGRTVVFFSTASHAMYGTTRVPAEEDAPVAPVNPYGRHKAALEETVAALAGRWLTLRLSHVVGPRQRPHQLLPALTEQVRAGSVRLYRDAHRDLVDAADVVGAVDALLTAGVRDRIVNVAAGTPYPVEEIVRGIERRLGRTAARESVPAAAQRTEVSVERLRRLAPDACPRGGAEYLADLLDRHVGGAGCGVQ
ncbi:NAD-dependent epimerase/dehydratase family protein [Kitasatospora aureofaciens]|uniref:NAD-dependent epimerase/dehydratase family protein n=1 Tax=Kitasatospora aureofaciens TaxID=1894 RepID=UPI00052590B1|nr:NAD-dependent epimerase/dehydratase family protein [Kitasatospora aureofaciens]